MKGKWILTLLLLTFCLSAKADDFQVVVVSGDVKLVESQVTPRPLAVLKRSLTVRIGPNGYLLLIDNSTNIFELKGEKSVLLDTLKGNLSYSSLNLELLYSEKSIASLIRSELPCLLFVKPFYFRMETTFQDTLTVSWQTRSTSAQYFVVAVENQFGDLLLKKITAGREYSVFLDFRNIDREDLFIKVTPYPKDRFCRSEFKCLKIRSRAINSTGLHKHTAGTALLKALFLETIGRDQDAEFYYKEAASLEADVEEFKSILSRFRARQANEKEKTSNKKL
jgi:hypothetical protein